MKSKPKIIPVIVSDEPVIAAPENSHDKPVCRITVNGMDIQIQNGIDDYILKAVLAEAAHAR
jgi:hypothetical protein